MIRKYCIQYAAYCTLNHLKKNHKTSNHWYISEWYVWCWVYVMAKYIKGSSFKWFSIECMWIMHVEHFLYVLYNMFNIYVFWIFSSDFFLFDFFFVQLNPFLCLVFQSLFNFLHKLFLPSNSRYRRIFLVVSCLVEDDFGEDPAGKSWATTEPPPPPCIGTTLKR